MIPREWQAFSRQALATARLFNQFWDAGVASEYTRMLMGKCDPARACDTLRRLSEDYQRLPTTEEIVRRARERTPGKRWITVARESMNGSRYSYAREIPEGAEPREHVKIGEKLIDVMDRSGERLIRWDQCPEGREFARLWSKLAGKPFTGAADDAAPEEVFAGATDDDIPF